MPTNERPEKPPEKASYPFHGCVFLPTNAPQGNRQKPTAWFWLQGVFLIRFHSRKTQETARKSKLPVNMAVLLYLTCWSASPTNEQHRKPPERASYPWTWLCYFTSLAEVLPLRTSNTGNRQKEQVTCELGCAILPQLLKCFLSWTRIAHLGSDLHSCPKTSIIARKGKLPVDRTAPTDEQRRQPPEKASSFNTRNLPTKNFQNHLPKVPPTQTQTQEITKIFIYKKFSLQISTFEMWHHRHEATPTSTKMTA